jgi:hypothetical protein
VVLGEASPRGKRKERSACGGGSTGRNFSPEKITMSSRQRKASVLPSLPTR